MWQVFWPETPRWSHSTGLVVAPTYRMLVDVVEPVCAQLWQPQVWKRTDHTMKIGRHVVLFRSADAPDRLRGLNASWSWIDEAAFVSEDVYRVVLARLREDGRDGLLWLTSTPRGRRSWLYELATSGSCHVVKSSTRENPFLGKQFVETLEKEYPSNLRLQELEGEFIDLGDTLIDITKAQWTEFDEDDVVSAVRYWDLAVSTKETADYTASVRIVRLRDGQFVATAPVRARMTYPETRARIVEHGLMELGTRVLVEANAFQLAAVQDLRADGRVMVEPVYVDRDKVSRAMPWIARLEGGALKLDSRYNWTPWLTEWSAFPSGDHDDTVDAMSGAWQGIAKPKRKLRVW
jgi:predicted phage terminase large subunit-like protein